MIVLATEPVVERRIIAAHLIQQRRRNIKNCLVKWEISSYTKSSIKVDD